MSCGGRGDRLDDVVIAGAAAEIALQPLADLFLGGIRIALHQIDRAHDHARRAEAALQRMVLAKRRLHRVQLAILGQALDRDDLCAFGLHREDRATLDRLTVDVHHAGAALAGVAPHMGAGQIEVLAKELDQERARLDLSRHRLAVHRHGNAGHSVSPLTPAPDGPMLAFVRGGACCRRPAPIRLIRRCRRSYEKRPMPVNGLAG